MATNPYNAPRARVADAAEEVGEAKFWSFSGRIGRMRYVAYNMAIMLVVMAVIFGIALVGGGAAAMGADGGGAAVMLLIIPVYILMIVVSFMITIQRVHDFNMSGWLSLLALFGAGIVFMFIPGTKGSNNYGPQPPPNSAGVLVLFWLFIASLLVLPILAAIAIPAYMGYVQRAQEMQMEQGGGQFDQQEFQRQMEELQQQMQQEMEQQGIQPDQQAQPQQ